jgi:hypothetical protein
LLDLDSALAAIIAGVRQSRLGTRTTAMIGLVLMAAGLIILMLAVAIWDSFDLVIIGMVVGEAGFMLACVALTIMATTSLDDRHAGLASGLVNTSNDRSPTTPDLRQASRSGGTTGSAAIAGQCCPDQLSVVRWPWRAEPEESVRSKPYIEYVFENVDLAQLDAAGALAAAEANEHTLITAETRRLQIAAHWADLHPGDAIPEDRLPGREHPVRLGGAGTPTVADFAPAELGCVLRISDGSACRLIGDALDLRHRLRLIWAAALTGQVPAYQARHIAAATRHLTAEQAAWVDQQLAPSLGAVSWGRLQTLLDAAIYQADPVGAEQRAAAAAQERFVRLGRNSEHGLKLIIARATAGDAIWFKATIDRIADILARQRDLDSVDIRRSKAIGILAQPAHALQLLCQHQHDDWDGPGEPTDEPTGDDEHNFDRNEDEEAAACDDKRGEDGQPEQDQAEEVGLKENDGEHGRDEEEPDQAEHHHVDQNQTDQAEQRHAEQHAGPAADHDQTATADTVDDQRPMSDPAESNTHRSLQILPPPFHPDRARPRAVIYVHLSEEALTAGRGLARVEQVGPVLLHRLRSLLGDHCTISLKPVIDLPAGHTPVDSYEIPARLREQLQLRNPADIFPYAAAVSRLIDVDHTIPYLSPDQGGPPGQTRIGNLGPHTRYHHRLKTHAGWQVRQPEPGTWLWRSPHHRIYLINATGTHPLGDTEFAQAIWRAAADPPHTDRGVLDHHGADQTQRVGVVVSPSVGRANAFVGATS